MTQPARVRDNRAKSKGRAIPPGPKASLDLDFLERNEYLSGYHNYDDTMAAASERAAGREIAKLEAEGRDAKARRLRKEVNLATEARWAVRSTWCPACLNVFHNCTCPVPDMPDKVEVDFIQSRFGRETKEEAKARRKEEARQKRLERKQKDV